MKLLAFMFLLVVMFVVSDATTNWLSHALYPCVRCLCHGRSGCWIRQNCARYSISEDYWTRAGSLTVTPNENTDHAAYLKCMADENCIVGTIIQYTTRFGDRDCNCDGQFDCKDLAAIHLKGASCENPQYGNAFAARFNECARQVGTTNMLPSEGTGSSCTVPSTF